MSDSNSSSSPVHVPAEAGNHFYDPNFTVEISQKMRVPKRIKVDGESDEPVLNGVNYEPPWANVERFDMRVPEKIIVLDDHVDTNLNGHDEHFGTRSFSPPEIAYENATKPPDISSIRIQTPPRVITLDKHHYPSADEFVPPPYMAEELRPAPPRPAPRSNPNMEIDNPHNSSNRYDSKRGDLLNLTVEGDVGMTINEEVVHLRKQLAKLNRRVVLIELETTQRQQRDKIMYAIGLAYLLFKTLAWIARSD